MAEKREEIELRSQFRIFSFSRLLSVNQSSLQRRRSRINLCFLELFSSLSSRFRWLNQSRKVLIPRKTIVACLSHSLSLSPSIDMKASHHLINATHGVLYQFNLFLHRKEGSFSKFEGVTKMILNWVFQHECCSPSFKDKKESLCKKGCYSFLPSFEGKFAMWLMRSSGGKFPFFGSTQFPFPEKDKMWDAKIFLRKNWYKG